MIKNNDKLTPDAITKQRASLEKAVREIEATYSASEPDSAMKVPEPAETLQPEPLPEA